MSGSSAKRGENEVFYHPDYDYSKTKSPHKISSLFFIIFLLFVILTSLISKRILYNTPELTETPFIGAEAWKDLKSLNDIGPKVTGTDENEVVAVNYLKNRIQKIISKANAAQNVELDHQIVSGSYFLAWKPHGMGSVYRSVQNLVVRVNGNESENALLLNCHFDSVPGSPGANDDLANCAIMLEVLSIVTQKEERTRHPIIFLFNGAEEAILKASHGFITQHKWAKGVKVLINLEAAGSGGKESLFQTGPGNSWLLNHFHKAKNPFSQAAGEEIFDSGLIPSDTDFRIFRDFGNVVGLDFAHIKSGYRYHTKFDHIDYLTMGVIQRTGENVLNIALSIANGFELNHPENFNKNDTSVYFDYLGFVFVHYPKELGVVINFIVVTLAIAIPFLALAKNTAKGHAKSLLSETILGLISIFVGLLVGLLACYVTGFYLDKAGHTLSWYRNTVFAPSIYGSAMLLLVLFSYDVIDTALANKRSPLSLGLKVQARINGVNIFWGIATLGLTVLGFRSGYLFMLMLLINLFTSIFIFFFGLNNSIHSWLYIYLIGQFFIGLWTSYFYNVVLDIFIPIMGRCGSDKNSEISISVITCVTTFFCISYIVPLMQLLRGNAVKYLTLLSIFLVSIFLITSTNYGFPYQDESTGNPTVQRFHVLHTSRNFYDVNGNLKQSDAGFIFLEWDRNAQKTIEGVTLGQTIMSKKEICEKNDEIFCGLPVVNSRLVTFGMSWLPAGSKPKIFDTAKIDHVDKFKIGNGLTKFVFTINSTSVSSITIRPRGNNVMTGWSFSKDFDQSSLNTHIVSVTNGVQSEIKPLKFDVTIKSAGDEREPLLDLAIITVHFERERDFNDELKKLLKRFPKWTFPVPTLVHINTYKY